MTNSSIHRISTQHQRYRSEKNRRYINLHKYLINLAG